MQRVRGRRTIVAALVGLAVALIAASAAAADPTYSVMNAEGGIYWRSEPNWEAAERISGFGVYNGTIIAVHCYQSGTAVEGSADTMWEQATDVGGRGYGSGWVNEHFINDGQPIDQPSPGVPPCNAPPPEEHPSGGDGGLVFPVFNAEGGIYYRNSPHWADTSGTPGVGVYNGDQVQLICGAFGDPVGPYRDTAWSYVNNLSRSVGDGWVNEHYINDGRRTNQFVPGEPMCGPEIPGVSGGGGPVGGGSGGGDASGEPPPIPIATGPQSIFYWPLLKSTEYPPGVPRNGVGDLTYEYPAWASGNCSTSRAEAMVVPGTINTLSGWSLSRLAPVYILDTHRAQWSQIHTLILFDPGNLGEMKYPGCESRLSFSINTLLVEWLKKASNNELLVLAGHDSESDSFHGLWHYYFKGIWGQPRSIKTRAVVCNYHGLPHPLVVKDFYQVVKAAGDGARPAGCPVSPLAHTPTQWDP